jgi:hypothetical protein
MKKMRQRADKTELKLVLSLESINNQNILNENNLNEIEIITAKLSNVSTNIILKIHQMNKVSHQRSLYELGCWSE